MVWDPKSEPLSRIINYDDWIFLANFEFDPSLESVLETAEQFSRKWVISCADSCQSGWENSQATSIAIDIIIVIWSYIKTSRGRYCDLLRDLYSTLKPSSQLYPTNLLLLSGYKSFSHDTNEIMQTCSCGHVWNMK